jgi:uncharacterized membrane protein
MLPIAQLHPIVVHFPIVFFLTLAAFDTVTLIRGSAISGRSCAATISAGLAVLAGLSAIAAYFAGDLAYDAAISSGVAAATLETHESLGTWTAVFIVIWSLLRSYSWWRGLGIEGGRKTAAVAIEIAGSLLIIAAAYFGGQLVYELGVNVSRAAGG